MAGDRDTVEVGVAIVGDNTGAVKALATTGKKAQQTGRQMSGDLGKAFRKVETDAKKSGRTMGDVFRGLNRSVGAFGDSVVGVAEKGAAAVLGLGLAFQQVAENVAGTVDEVGTFAAMSGFTADTINGLRIQAERTNKQLSDIVPKDLPKRLLETSQGTGEALRGFAALEIDVKDATGALRSADSVLPEILDKLARVENPTTKAALAVQILGAEGQQMLSAFEDSAGLTAVVEEGRRFGIQVGPDAVAASNQWFNATANLTIAWETAQQALFDTFGPAATQFLNNFALGFFRVATVAEEVVNTIMGEQSLEQAFINADRRAFEFWQTLTGTADAIESEVEPAVRNLRDSYDDVGIMARQAAVAAGGAKEPVEELTGAVIELEGPLLGVKSTTEEIGRAFNDAFAEANEAVDEFADETKFTTREIAEGWVTVGTTIADTISALAQQNLDTTLALANESIEAARATGRMSEEQILQLAQTEQDAVVKAWRLNRAAQISAAIIDAARAAVAMIPAFAFAGPLAPVLAAGTAAAALGVQLAAINAQGPPVVNYPTGGVVGPVMPDHRLVGAQDGEGIASLRAMEDPSFRAHLDAANKGRRSGPRGGGDLELRVSYDRSARRLMVTPRRRSVGKRMSNRRR